jgi:hypothetical protein
MRRFFSREFLWHSDFGFLFHCGAAISDRPSGQSFSSLHSLSPAQYDEAFGLAAGGFFSLGLFNKHTEVGEGFYSKRR